MILIRGIKGEQYARRIEKGVVDCRDILSALLQPPETGYEYSDYYEKNLVRALAFFPGEEPKLDNPRFLYSLLIDYYVPHIYLTYFHILNENSLEWLNKFEDDYHFIAMNAKLDKNTQTIIGNEFFGAKMTYVDSINQISQDGYKPYNVAVMCSIENQFKYLEDMLMPLQIYNTLAFSLLCREKEGKFSDIENEFRIIAYDCPKFENGSMKQSTRNAKIIGNTGIEYNGVLEAGKDSIFKSNLCLLNNPQKSLNDIVVDENGKITLDSQFKPINVRSIAKDCKYLGDKNECEKYIKDMLKRKPKDIYVNRTRQRIINLDDCSNVSFAPSMQKVKY